jgi:TrmH family RNA methyltransferase
MFVTILVEPKIEGNIGAIARTMKNFGMTKLILVKPNRLGTEAYQRATHSTDILDNALIVDSFDSAISNVDLVVGTSAITDTGDKHYLRTAMTPTEFAMKILKFEGIVGILFGREDFGLTNKELEKCDLLVKIPCNPTYPVLNISHAASIIFYELYKNTQTKVEHVIRSPSRVEKEKLYDYFTQILDLINYPEHKKKDTVVMFRRLIGRSMPSKWELLRLIGVFNRIVNINH